VSGYLQRLVSTAAGRGGAVHPRTGSVFAPRREEMSAPLQGWEDAERVAPEPSPHPRAASVEFESSPTPQPTSAPVFAHTPLLPASLEPDMRTIAAAPPPLRDTPEIDEEPFVSPDEPPPAAAGRHHRAATNVHVTTPMTTPITRIADDAFRPAEAAPAPPSEARMQPVSSRRASPEPRAALGRPPAVRQPVVREPDEIQIHIGRIEVIAVPPPAPRAPKAPDRSPSLDAYLNRRNGRSR
jgi:hypothetical protein